MREREGERKGVAREREREGGSRERKGARGARRKGQNPNLTFRQRQAMTASVSEQVT